MELASTRNNELPNLHTLTLRPQLYRRFINAKDEDAIVAYDFGGWSEIRSRFANHAVALTLPENGKCKIL